MILDYCCYYSQTFDSGGKDKYHYQPLEFEFSHNQLKLHLSVFSIVIGLYSVFFIFISRLFRILYLLILTIRTESLSLFSMYANLFFFVKLTESPSGRPTLLLVVGLRKALLQISWFLGLAASNCKSYS